MIRSLNRIGLALCTLGLLSPIKSSAQEPAQFLFTVGAPTAPLQPEAVLELAVTAFPSEYVMFHASTAVLEVITLDPITLVQINTILAPSAHAAEAMAVYHPEQALPVMTAGEGIPPFPVERPDVDDPAAGFERHRQAKEAWISAHPEAYKAMLSDRGPKGDGRQRPYLSEQ